MPSAVTPVSCKATAKKDTSSGNFTLPEPLRDALIAARILKPLPAPRIKRYEMPLPKEHFEDVVRFDMVGVSRFERMKKRTAHVNAVFNRKIDAMNEEIRREMRQGERISTSRKIKQALHIKVEPLPSEKPIPVIRPPRGCGYAIFDSDKPDVSSEPKNKVEDDKIVKAMLQNERRGTLTALPANVLDTIAKILTDVDVMCLRQTSHRFLRHLDKDDNDDDGDNEEDAESTTKFSRFHMDDFAFSPLKVHAYAHPWDPRKLGNAEATADFKARLQRDLFCNDCQAARQAKNYHSRVTALKKLMHCRDCDCDHPAVLFSADIRNKADDEHRVCIGRQGAVSICGHSALRYQDVEESRARLEPGSSETIACTRHEPRANTTRNGQEAFRPTATLKKDEDNDEMMVKVSWQGDLCFDICANDCTAQAMRDWLASLSSRDHDTGLMMCPHLSLTDGSAAAAMEGMWDPQRCVCVTYPGAEKVGEYRLRARARLDSLDCRAGGCGTDFRPFESGRRGIHQTTCRVCAARVSVRGTCLPVGDDPYRLKLEYTSLPTFVTSPTDLAWLALIDPASYAFTADHDARNVTWCPEPRCANYFRFQRLGRVLRYEAESPVAVPCSDHSGCLGAARRTEEQ